VGAITVTLSSGSRDRLILQRDVRVADHFTSKLSGHKQEVQFQMGPLDGLPDGLPDDLPDGLPHQVCGLKWSFDGQQLASGGNDNKLYVWSPHSTSPLLRFNEHTAAVKAISWSPHQNGLLASGGGTADRCIRFWNTQTASPLNSIDTGSQVCDGARQSQPRSACMCSPRRLVPSPQVCDRRVPLLAAQLLDCL
jgi:cell division cycle 20-like protein 1 (cofactor of APC complex)